MPRLLHRSGDRVFFFFFFFFSSRRRHTRLQGDWSSDVCSSDLTVGVTLPTTDLRLGHALALRRVLLNLTTNALKFTERGSVEIVAAEQSATRVRFFVRDTGPGINPEALSSLYHPFRRSAKAGRYLFSGTGLGLALTRRLVQAMGSELCLETQPGWGTQFSFDLELPPADPT